MIGEDTSRNEFENPHDQKFYNTGSARTFSRSDESDHISHIQLNHIWKTAFFSSVLI